MAKVLLAEPNEETRKPLQNRRSRAQNKLPTAGFEPATSCSTGRRSKPTELRRLHSLEYSRRTLLQEGCPSPVVRRLCGQIPEPSPERKRPVKIPDAGVWGSLKSFHRLETGATCWKPVPLVSLELEERRFVGRLGLTRLYKR